MILRLPALLTAFALVLAVPVASVSAAPVSDANRQAAAESFRDGVAKFEAESYDEALDAFERAHSLEPHYGFLYNIGVSQLQLGRVVEARGSLRRYLAEGGDGVDAARRKSVELRLEELEGKIGGLSLQGGPEGAAVSIDGDDVGALPLSQPIELAAGAHRVSVTAEGYEPWADDIDVAPGPPTVVQLELVAIASEPVVEEPPPPSTAEELEPTHGPVLDEPPPVRSDRPLRIATWSMLGITVASGIATAVVGGLTVRANDDLDNELERIPADPGAVEDAENTRRTLARTTDALIGVTAVFGAVTLGLGIATLVRGRRAARVSATAGGLQVRF